MSINERNDPLDFKTPSRELVKALAPTGVLRAVINLGNPVLAQGDAFLPTGITVMLAREMAAWMGLQVEFLCVEAARDAYTAMAEGRADVCFLADEPKRREHIAFTPPYVVLEGVYATAPLAPFEDATKVDRAGVTIAVRRGSAYDLYLTRTITEAQIVRAEAETDAYEQHELDVVAGVRQPLTAYASSSGSRILEPPFMRIQQSVGLPKSTADETVGVLADWLEHIKSTLPIRTELDRINAGG
ncbi:transporter substrate-binding domain-containing protein [Arthrobacter bambusae]|uniref:transporter substrate-binding domain-containing protein n=1 Tax=Arthrobacter bambusae TaxID=1338426 RepID=UPI00278AE464|nr:transporter substrate-binding domain-containing protein [Arthrobacter bambusae]MDQ0029074.1 polar amino acid transport system substrate-binding protein [Arthrobacter bambusae]MDQ0098524.1 polar amino acid transport system substrate-binding protein [Arthrobacter bambusae]